MLPNRTVSEGYAIPADACNPRHRGIVGRRIVGSRGWSKMTLQMDPTARGRQCPLSLAVSACAFPVLARVGACASAWRWRHGWRRDTANTLVCSQTSGRAVKCFCAHASRLLLFSHFIIHFTRAPKKPFVHVLRSLRRNGVGAHRLIPPSPPDQPRR